VGRCEREDGRKIWWEKEWCICVVMLICLQTFCTIARRKVQFFTCAIERTYTCAYFTKDSHIICMCVRCEVCYGTPGESGGKVDK
jgi:hypothetical protein